jgi:ABC-type molybdenum transport system ATPase subunit/photorepair protein PhrA
VAVPLKDASENRDTICDCGLVAQREAVRDGWLQGRYHSGDGETVAEMLSFNSVFEINPFEVGADHAAERRVYAARKRFVDENLELKGFARRAFLSLSTGEMRRVLFARAILTGAKRIVSDDLFDGLDVVWCRKLRILVAALRREGVRVAVGGRHAFGRSTLDVPANSRASRRNAVTERVGRVAVSLRGVNVSFGARTLFRNFSWTIREGERWLLKGPNGSGKTTLLALLSGDSPLAYAFDISLFGKRRGAAGVTLADLRAHIGIVSAERCAYLRQTIGEQLDAALRRGTRILLLDEPCYGLPPQEEAGILSRISAWLDSHPRVAAICVAHRRGHVPAGFTHELSLAGKPNAAVRKVGRLCGE